MATVDASEENTKAKRVLEYCVETKECGLVLKPDVNWDGNPEFKFVIRRILDSKFAKDPETLKGVSDNSTLLCGAPDIQSIQAFNTRSHKFCSRLRSILVWHIKFPKTFNIF
jgi:hypothetical protein